jgi:hypothetical protein
VFLVTTEEQVGFLLGRGFGDPTFNDGINCSLTCEGERLSVELGRWGVRAYCSDRRVANARYSIAMPGRERVKMKRFLSAALAAAAVGVVATSVALADPTSSHSGGAFANQIGNVKIDPNDPTVAYVTGNYNCPASPGGAHLFVSVKQVAGGKPDSGLKGEGSSQLTLNGGAWLFRHPAQSTFTCDDTWHTGTWRIDSDHSTPGDPDGYGGWGSLVPGQVYVQFCWDSPDDGATWHAYSEQFAHASY